MDTITQPEEMSAWSKRWARKGKTICLVPTMGFFHDGHLSLMKMAGRRADKVVVSLFVNPTQFGEGEDFTSYPRDLERDAELARREGVDVLFAPEAENMYLPGCRTSVVVDELTEGLCGASRPGHFTGVATVVTKLFNIVRPNSAVFGEKDFQQLAVIRRLTLDLNLGVEIIGHPIVREKDGLARSSRNTYLDPDDREAALSLFRSLKLARENADQGVLDAAKLTGLVREFILSHPGTEIDYVSFVDSRNLKPVSTIDRDTLLALAVKIKGKVRLIDNGFIL